MSRRSEQLRTVLRLAEQEEGRAAEALAIARRRLDEARAQSEQLATYERDYHAQREQSGRRGLDSFRLQNWQQFLANLEQAVALQTQRQQQVAEEVERAVVGWRGRHLRRRSLERLVQSALREEQQLRDKKEQRALDDRPRAPQR